MLFLSASKSCMVLFYISAGLQFVHIVIFITFIFSDRHSIYSDNIYVFSVILNTVHSQYLYKRKYSYYILVI